MKNIHLINTNKPSRLFYDISIDKLVLATTAEISRWFQNKNIFITSNEEIKEGNWCLDLYDQRWKLQDNKLVGFDNTGIKRFSTDNIKGHQCKKIILTTDQELIKDGVQAIKDEFLEWFVKNPSCEEVKVDLVPINEFGSEMTIVTGYGFDKFIYKIIIQKESQCTCERYNDNTCNYCENKQSKEILESAKINANKQETLEQAAERINYFVLNGRTPFNNGFREGAKWQQERSYSEEDMIEFSKFCQTDEFECRSVNKSLLELFEQFKNK